MPPETDKKYALMTIVIIILVIAGLVFWYVSKKIGQENPTSVYKTPEELRQITTAPPSPTPVLPDKQQLKGTSVSSKKISGTTSAPPTPPPTNILKSLSASK